jgi:TP901 family phage tail tape measure protein
LASSRPAAVLNVIVTASTGQASARLMTLQRQLGMTAATAQKSDAALRRFGTGAATAGALAAAGSAKLAIDFDRGMRNVNSIAQLSERQLKSLSGRVLDLAGPTAQAPQTLAEGLYDLVSSGFDANESLTVLKSSATAATAGLTDAATSTKVTAAVLNAYRLPAERAKAVSDQLFRTVDRGVITFDELAQNIGDTLPFAASLGVGLEEVGAATATMTKQGLGAPETMTRIRNLLQTMIKPGTELAKTMEELGYESGEAMVRELGLQGALDELVGTTNGTKDEVAKLFPNIRALGGALALTGDNSRAASRDLRDMRDASGATARALSQQSQSVSYQWQQLRSEGQATAVEFGNHLLPVLADGIGVIRDVGGAVGDVADWVDDLPDPIKDAVVGIVGMTAGLKGAAVAFGLLQTIGLTSLTRLRAAITAHPIGALAVLVTGAAAALGAFEDNTSRATLGMRKFGNVGWAARESMKRLDKQLGQLGDSEERVRRLTKRSEQANKDVKQAQDELNRARRESGPASKETLEAERKLVNLRRKENRINRDLAKAERLNRWERKQTRPVIEKALADNKDLVEAQKRGVEQSKRYYRQQKQQRGNDRAEAEALDTLIDRQKKLREARRDQSKIMARAAEEIGPKYARRLEDMTALELRVGKKRARQYEATAKASRLQNRAIEALMDTGVSYAAAGRITANKTDEYLRQIIRANSDAFNRTAKHGKDKARELKDGVVGSAKGMTSGVKTAYQDMEDATNKVLRALGVDAVSFSVSKSGGSEDRGGGKRAQKGAVLVPGTAPGDHVPVHVGGRLAGIVEPGELVSVMNKEATKRAMEWNAAVPRFQEGGLVQALGPHDVPPIQYAADHAGGNSHWHIHMATRNAVVAIGRQLQQMGFDVSEHPAFGGVNYRHSATGGHYDALAIDVNSAADETLAETRQVARLLSGRGGVAAAAERIARRILEGPDGPFRDAGQAAIDRGHRAMNRYLMEHAPRVTGGYSGSTSGPLQAIARRMVESRWGPRQWSFFDELVQRESGWNPRAVNPSSGAAGLAQALPPSKYPPGAWPYEGKESAVKQLQWMVNYVAERYGNPAGAIRWHDAHNWYAKGGVLPPFGGSFDEGGVVPGPRGAPRTIIAHGGEHVTGGSIQLVLVGKGAHQAFATLDDVYAIVGSRRVEVDRHSARMARQRRG